MSPEDAQHVKNLFDIVAACAAHSEKFGGISNEAMSELLGMNRTMREAAMKATAEARAADAAVAGQTGNTDLVSDDDEINQPAEDPNARRTARTMPYRGPDAVTAADEVRR